MFPFIKKFKTQDFYYIYDVNTNEILQVDEIVYDLIDYIYGEIPIQILQKYSKKKIKETKEKIKKSIVEEKLFMQNRPQKLKFRFNINEIKEKLENELKILGLNITENCNMRCKYCIYSGQYYLARTHSCAKMNIKTALNAIDFFFAHNKKRVDNVAITFFGGEPLLNFKLIKQCVEYARDKNRRQKQKLEFSITTNGTLLNDNTIDFLKREKIILGISIDGPKEIHDCNRVFKNGQGTFDLIMKNILNIKKRYPQYYDQFVSFIVTIAPPFELLKREAFFNHEDIFDGKEIKVNFLNSSLTCFFNNFDKDIFNQLAYQNGLVMKNYIDSHLKGNIYYNRFGRSLYEHYFRKIHYRPVCSRFEKEFIVPALCVPGQLRPFVDVNGKLHICEKLDNQMVIGDIEKGFDINKIKLLINEFLDISNSECCNCWAIRFCELCYPSAFAGEIFSIEEKNKRCKRFRKALRSFLIVYNQILEKNQRLFDYLLPFQ